jgi:DnaJ domain
MFGLWTYENISIALVNIALIALWPVSLLLIFAFVRQCLVVRRVPSNFPLRKSETVELDRATLLYEKTSGRIKEIREHGRPPARLWRSVLGSSVNFTEHDIDELDELEAHAQHLQATIVRLTRQPLMRLRSWVHAKSSQSALGLALATHVVALVFLNVAFFAFEQSMWVNEFETAANGLVWYPLDERLFYANAVATGFASIALPLFYLMRRAALRRKYDFEFSLFEDLANSRGASSIGEPQPDSAADGWSQQTDADNLGGGGDWAAVLGLSKSATIREIKEAYKVLIKQNHPDQVHNMSGALKTLAEAETKKINAAYQQALLSVPSY